MASNRPKRTPKANVRLGTTREEIEEQDETNKKKRKPPPQVAPKRNKKTSSTSRKSPPEDTITMNYQEVELKEGGDWGPSQIFCVKNYSDILDVDSELVDI